MPGRPLPTNLREFDELVSEAIDSLPLAFRSKLDNIVFKVENSRKGHPETLGFYHGVPIPGQSPTLGTPTGFITLYRKTILAQCRDREELVKQVRHIVVHEVAHHFGFSDGWLRNNGDY